MEKAIAEAKEAKEGIESSEAYKEEKTKLSKFDSLLMFFRRVKSRCGLFLFWVIRLDPL